MRIFYKIISFFLTIPLIVFISIFTISNSNVTIISFWPFEKIILIPVWALALIFFISGLLIGCILTLFNKYLKFLK